MNFEFSTLEITTRIGCPVACSYCPQAKTAKDYVGERVMTVETLSKCLDKVPRKINSFGKVYPRIDFSGFSEPFSNPHCSELINVVYDKGFDNITLYTTLRGMTMEDFNKIKHIPLLFASIHLPDVEGLADIPIHEDYFNLLDALTSTYQIGFFAYGKINLDVINFLVNKYPESFNGRFHWVTDVHSRAGNVDGITARERVNGPIKCNHIPYMELDHNVLLPNGDVSLCCMDFSRKHIVGNLLTGTYEDIFKSDEHNRVVAGMFVDNMDILCRYCDYATPNMRMV